MSDAIINLLNDAHLDKIIALVLLFGGGIAIVVTAIVLHHIRESRRRELDASLKLEMLARDMSADEIERVLAARIGSKDGGEK